MSLHLKHNYAFKNIKRYSNLEIIYYLIPGVHCTFDCLFKNLNALFKNVNEVPFAR